MPYLVGSDFSHIPSADSCFLCGRCLEGCRSLEHVFPQWLQRRFNLWDKHLVLLNHTEIPYRDLLIPCCLECNNTHLSRLEKEIKYALDNGIDGLVLLGEKKIFQWLLKILYGILYKESFLLIDRKDSSKGRIVSRDIFRDLDTLHWLMQSVRTPFHFVLNAWSIFYVRTYSYGDERDFDFRDNTIQKTVSIRMGDVGIIASLQDNNIVRASWDILNPGLDRITLHPLQFSELYARIDYSTSLINRTPKYVSVNSYGNNQKTFILPLPMQGFSTKPIFSEWDDDVYGHYLLAYCGGLTGWTDISVIQSDSGIPTFLFNPDGTYRQLSPDYPNEKA